MIDDYKYDDDKWISFFFLETLVKDNTYINVIHKHTWIVDQYFAPFYNGVALELGQSIFDTYRESPSSESLD